MVYLIKPKHRKLLKKLQFLSINSPSYPHRLSSTSNNENPNTFLLAMEKWVILSFVFALVVSGELYLSSFSIHCLYGRR